ncbi:MAG: hypothetical protein GY929_08285 [Actinomycetia bacterium]|nr:hypothetical protein [Actinomycetes bacterium]
MLALGAFIGRSQPEYPMTPSVLESRVVGREPECSWEVDIEFRNDSDRRLRLISVELALVDDSRNSFLGGFDPGESIIRTYRYALVDCSAPGGGELIATYGPTLTKQERSVSFAFS